MRLRLSAAAALALSLAALWCIWCISDSPVNDISSARLWPAFSRIPGSAAPALLLEFRKGYRRSARYGSLIGAQRLATRNIIGANSRSKVQPPRQWLAEGSSALRRVSLPRVTAAGSDGRSTAPYTSERIRTIALLAVGLLVIVLMEVRRRRTRFRLREYAAILDALPAMVGYWDAKLQCRFANKSYSSHFGVKSRAVRGIGIQAFHGDELYRQISGHVEAVMRGETLSFEQTIAGRDGAAPSHFLAQFVPDRVAGRLRGFYAVKHDITAITDDKHNLAALAREREALLSTLHQHALVSVADARGRITDANSAFCAISGYSRDELIGCDHRVVSSGTHPPEFWKGLWGSIGKGKPWRGEICNRAKDGSLYWVDSIIAPFVGENGRITKYISIRNDVTAQKEAQRRLSESETFLERVEEVSGVGGFSFNLTNDMIRWTRQAHRLYEVETEFIPSLEVDLDFYSPEARAQLREAIQAARESGTGYDLDVAVKTAKGRAIWVRLVGNVECEGGKPVRIIGTMQDITDRRAMNQRLQDATASAQKANMAKSEFLANMSHEIRTPLNAVIGLGYLLEQTNLSEDQRQFLTKIQFAGRALLGVINNVLDLSKIEAGEMLLEDEPFNLLELVQDLSQMMAPQASAKGIELTVKTAIDLPRMVKGDASRLRQMLTNLVSNSIKFTEVGQVSLDLSGTITGADGVRLRCEVRDSGIGIEPEALERLFTPFNQADASTTRRFGGTGLGLSITRRFVELMGGEIGVSSMPAVGSTFWIELPLRCARSGDDTSTGIRARSLQIFIADSVGDVPGGLGAMVRALGWTAQVAANCEPLLQLIGDNPPDTWPDALIIDERVLDSGARQMVLDLMGRYSPNECPPIIVVTEFLEPLVSCEHFVRQSDLVLVRPATSSALFNAVNSAVWQRRDGRERVMQSTIFDEQRAQWLVGVRVLAVDDSEINLEVVRRILEKQGAIVTSCSDGKAALECVRVNHKQLDIVLMDVQMPILDGNETARRIRGELQLTTLPIVALTAGALVNERQRALEAGMNDFVSKPFNPRLLIRKVRRLVEHARGAPLPVIVLETQPLRQTDGLPSIASIDPGVFRRIFGEEGALFNSVVARVLRDNASFELPVTLAPDDHAGRTELQRRAHKLKGSAGMIGATRLMRLAGAVEKALADGRSNEVVERILKQLASALAMLRVEALPSLVAQLPLKVMVGPDITVERAVGAAGLDELRVLLDDHNLDAVEAFTVLAPHFKAALSATRFERLREAIDSLDFPLGAQLLREARLPQAVSAVDAS
jgi:two-component system, sensor histidine kinase and response regulator